VFIRVPAGEDGKSKYINLYFTLIEKFIPKNDNQAEKFILNDDNVFIETHKGFIEYEDGFKMTFSQINSSFTNSGGYDGFKIIFDEQDVRIKDHINKSGKIVFMHEELIIPFTEPTKLCKYSI